MKARNLLITSGLLGLLSLSAVSCGEAKPAPAAPTVQPSAPTQSVQTATREGEIKLAREVVMEAEKEYKATQAAYKEKLTSLKSAKAELQELEDADTAKRDGEKGQLEALMSDRDQLAGSLKTYRDFLVSDVQRIEDTVAAASEGITNSEEEFQRMAAFGDVNITGEILLYTLGFKWLWGAFVLYQPTLFTYNPEHSRPLREKLAEQQERLHAVQELLRSAVSEQKAEGINSDVALAHEKIGEALDFFTTNKVAAGSRTVKSARYAFLEQKRVLASITEFIPANQVLLEEAVRSIQEITMSREERKKKIEAVKANIKHLNGSIKALLAEANAKKAKLEKEREALEKLVKKA